tara:strand:- start:42 stop:809 length:768 start_codon:yes stop_codon:yes gene_type:complete
MLLKELLKDDLSEVFKYDREGDYATAQNKLREVMWHPPLKGFAEKLCPAEQNYLMDLLMYVLVLKKDNKPRGLDILVPDITSDKEVADLLIENYHLVSGFCSAERIHVNSLYGSIVLVPSHNNKVHMFGFGTNIPGEGNLHISNFCGTLHIPEQSSAFINLQEGRVAIQGAVPLALRLENGNVEVSRRDRTLVYYRDDWSDNQNVNHIPGHWGYETFNLEGHGTYRMFIPDDVVQDNPIAMSIDVQKGHITLLGR